MQALVVEHSVRLMIRSKILHMTLNHHSSSLYPGVVITLPNGTSAIMVTSNGAMLSYFAKPAASAAKTFCFHSWKERLNIAAASCFDKMVSACTNFALKSESKLNKIIRYIEGFLIVAKLHTQTNFSNILCFIFAKETQVAFFKPVSKT